MKLKDVLSSVPIAMPAVEQHLDSLSSSERIVEVRSLGRAQLARLFEAAAGYRAITLEHIVPGGQSPMDEVVHYGKNSLGVFTHFHKVFVRPGERQRNGELWGYNRNSALLEAVVGPGYFVAYPHTTDGEILVDYLRTPHAKPAHWPKILPNSARLSFFVYNGTQDVLRGVSQHVSIGRATKKGKPMPAWFALCREDN